MKLKIKLKTTTSNGKEVILKLNVAPTKYLGLFNFINSTINQKSSIELGFEKISKTGERDESKIVGIFNFEVDKGAEMNLLQLTKEIKEKSTKHKKELQKRRPK